MKLINDRIAFGYQELIEAYGISKNTVNSGLNSFRSTESYHWEHFKDDQIFVYYNTLPKNTRKKLPTESELLAECKNQHKKGASDAILKKLQYSQQNKFFTYQQTYREQYGLSAEKALPKAMKAAVWDRLLQLHTEYSAGGKGGLQKGMGEAMLKAYNMLYPASYVKESFSRALKEVKAKGVTVFCLDARILSNREKHAQKYDARQVALLRALVSSGKAYKAPYILGKLQEACLLENIPCPSITWVKDQKAIALQNTDIFQSRYGAEQTDKQMPYADISPAFFADDQYQIDGWDLPFYYVGTNSNGKKALRKLMLIAVWDAYSKKIVGYCISQSENRLSLFDALQDAVDNTGALPLELVSDNHSYNETKEVDSFKQAAERLGFRWTVDSNPKRKITAERGFKKLGEQYCIGHYAYVGQGIRTKDKDGRTKQELIDQYLKAGKTLTEDAIKVIGIAVVEKYNNNTPLAQKGKSPNQLYEESEKPHRLTVDLLEKLKLFTKSTSYKVNRGQINIEIAGQDYHYQLPAEYYAKYNNKQVTVRYESTDLIYLFDQKTDAPITALKQKERISGALANQTTDDTDKYNRHKGRLSGIKADARKENEAIVAAATKLSPGILDTVNRVTTPKSVQKLLESEEVTRQAKNRGIDIDRIPATKVFSEVDNPVFKEPVRTKNQRSPYTPTNHKITEILPDEY